MNCALTYSNVLQFCQKNMVCALFIFIDISLITEYLWFFSKF